MSLSSSFTNFSLAELFQLIDQGKKSGCLTVSTLPDLYAPGSKSQLFYIWFRQGCIIAAANRLNGQDLSNKLIQRKWVNIRLLEQICEETAITTPLGLYLKTQAVLSAEQLNLLFASQLQQVRALFEIQKGIFKLDSKAPLPWKEMTGISLRAIEVALMALRVLKNWGVLADVIPDKSSTMRSITQNKLQIRLNALESQVWVFANGSVNLNAIASELNQPTILVQQAAFRLMVAGLLEEVSISIPEVNSYPMSWKLPNSSVGEAKKSQEPETRKISTSFLENLVGFLRSKT
jgi:Ni,Fe-hydrogenase I large subunit